MKFHRGPVNTEQVLHFLRHWARHVRGRFVLLWDGLPAHRAAAVRKWLARHARIQVERLPAYSPDLNGVEGLWSWLKGGPLANLCTELEELRLEARGAVKRARMRQQRLRGFLEKTGLTL